MGPDGAIYFLEWQNPIIGHMQHNLRDPSRDQTHGRVYRVTYEGRPLLEPKAIAGQPISKLLDLLKEPEDRVRDRVRIELSARESGEVITVTRQWLERLDSKDPEYEHHILEGLWVHQQHNQINVPLLKRVLASKDHRARAAATRVLCYWADRIPDSLEMLKQLAADSHPRVRLEAVWAASFFQVPEAVEIPAIAADYPMDYYLEYVKRETLRTLDPYLKSTLAANKKINVTSDAGARFLLSSVDLASLLKMERNRAVCMELLLRAGVPDADRLAGAESLARMEHRTVATVLMDAVQQFDRNSQTRNPLVLFDLVRMLGRRGEELKKVRQDIEKLATQGTNDLVRQLAMVALVAADGDAEPTWQLAQSSPSALRDFVSAIPNIGDPSARAGLYPKLIPLLRGFPSNMNVPKTAGAALGRFVRIELPGNRRTLTLAEVEVMSNGVNVARHGKAKQKNTSHGGNAARGIDGNKAGQFNRGGQTHTQENTANPWWEVDLGADVPIQSVHVYNRTDERLGQRLNGFSLVILDGNRQEVYRKDDIPAPPRSKEFPVSGSSPESLLRQAVMKALVSVRGKETETFKALVPFVTHGPDRASAAQAMQRISATHWPAEDLSSLVNATMEYLRKVPVAERTEPEPAEMIQLAYALATRLPRDRATAVRKELGDIGVRVIRLSTVPEQMIYDQDRLVMQAGKPVEILFDNPDLMPHNLVFVVPGALVEVGELAEKTGNDSTALDREYVPVSDKILSASRLLQPRQKLRMAFTPPNKPGVYPYVCTYPGHWRRMYGALYVVENLEEYLSSPEAYLTNHPMDIRDEMLKLNRPRKEWKLEELAAELTNLKGRSFGNGKQIFTVANCIACHRLNNVGTQFGPELDKLDPKLTPKDVLQSILEPSHKIDDKFATYSFPMDSGKVITGMIVGESPDVIKVIENPLASAKPTELPRGEVLGRKKSNVSLMPKGLLDKLTKEEILDLVAYVLAKGDAKHAVFQGSHDHGQANEHRKHDK
jgi:putative heme-binding domain-containing protein